MRVIGECAFIAHDHAHLASAIKLRSVTLLAGSACSHAIGMHARRPHHTQCAVMKHRKHLVMVCGDGDAVERDAHAKQIAFEFFRPARRPLRR